MTLEERIKEAFRTENVQEIADKLGKTYQAVYHYLKGQRKLSNDTLLRIRSLTNCSIDWILTGEGKKFTDPGEKSIERRENLNYKNTGAPNKYTITLELNEDVRSALREFASESGETIESQTQRLLIEGLIHHGKLRIEINGGGLIVKKPK